MSTKLRDISASPPSLLSGGHQYQPAQGKKLQGCTFTPHSWAQPRWRSMGQGTMQPDINLDLPRYSEIVQDPEERMYLRSPDPSTMSYVPTASIMIGGHTEAPLETQARNYGYALSASKTWRDREKKEQGEQEMYRMRSIDSFQNKNMLEEQKAREAQDQILQTVNGWRNV